MKYGFSDRLLRELIPGAQKEAERLGHDCITSGDVLLGLLWQRNGLPAKVLKGLGLNLWEIRGRTERMMEMGWRMENWSTGQDIEVLVNVAVEAALDMRHSRVEAVHFLWALTQRKGVPRRVLSKMGVNFEVLRRKVTGSLVTRVVDPRAV